MLPLDRHSADAHRAEYDSQPRRIADDDDRREEREQYCRFINPCFDAKSAAIKIEKCGKIEKFGQALNEGLSSRGKSADVPTEGAETSPRDGEDVASTMGRGAERTLARETGPEEPRVLVRPSQPRSLVVRLQAGQGLGPRRKETKRRYIEFRLSPCSVL